MTFTATCPDHGEQRLVAWGPTTVTLACNAIGSTEKGWVHRDSAQLQQLHQALDALYDLANGEAGGSTDSDLALGARKAWHILNAAAQLP